MFPFLRKGPSVNFYKCSIESPRNPNLHFSQIKFVLAINLTEMPKDRTGRSSSFNRSRVSPYTCNSKNTELYKSDNPLLSVGDEKEWEDARCPICMEHPHNAVLLLCSSHEKGCRPFMCDTSYRHSNCLDQFCKPFATTQSTAQLEEGALSSTSYHRGGEDGVHAQPTRFNGRQQPKLVCPLCRGRINESIVIEPARQFMNSKSRNCSLETCDFSGTYSELRKHARLEHPSVRPSEADTTRQHDWMRLEQRELEDLLSALDSGNEWGEDSILRQHELALLEDLWDAEDIFNSVVPDSEYERGFVNAYQLDSGDEQGEDSILRQHELMVLEEEFVKDILNSVESDSEDERSENNPLLVDFEFELPLSFLEEILPSNPWFETRE
ncbi:hypothetical protein F0562_023032 [Nyssa sinensis]|uniref:Uncharacterized protein n=1 Tax=Nyssa sinensis TaxID=561372 RepID=A0A5J5BHX8_9ASTE|nr:hypothetical protein F0562_023032 [Nyssa sinensis]